MQDQKSKRKEGWKKEEKAPALEDYVKEKSDGRKNGRKKRVDGRNGMAWSGDSRRKQMDGWTDRVIWSYTVE